MRQKNMGLWLALLALAACGGSTQATEEATTDSGVVEIESPQPEAVEAPQPEAAAEPAVPAVLPDTVGLPDSAFVDMALFGDTFVLDMRYATDNNFTGKTVYPCAVCKYRYVVAKGLLKVAEVLAAQDLKLKFYDCYRPVDVQRIFWEIFPDARYVANPNTSGSSHNRGAAADLTIVEATGQELDMGTGFDHFGEEAHHAYTELPQQVLDNRALLREAMEAGGFLPIRTEWWHYYHHTQDQYGLANDPLCLRQTLDARR